jgi:hypothetical protein
MTSNEEADGETAWMPIDRFTDWLVLMSDNVTTMVFGVDYLTQYPYAEEDGEGLLAMEEEVDGKKNPTHLRKGESSVGTWKIDEGEGDYYPSTQEEAEKMRRLVEVRNHHLGQLAERMDEVHSNSDELKRNARALRQEMMMRRSGGCKCTIV